MRMASLSTGYDIFPSFGFSHSEIHYDVARRSPDMEMWKSENF